MADESSVPRFPAVVRQLRARLRGRRSSRSSGYGSAGADTADAPGASLEYFCRTCGARFEGRHGTCPQCGGGMIEQGAESLQSARTETRTDAGAD